LRAPHFWQQRAVPILDGLKLWFEEQRRRLSSKTTLAKAIRYALTRWEALTRYTGDGRIGIDNNPAERSLRGIALTRKNFLFLGSEGGGDRAATLYTVLETAKRLCLRHRVSVFNHRANVGLVLRRRHMGRGEGMRQLPQKRRIRTGLKSSRFSPEILPGSGNR
jgi:hypothetical protein